MKVFSTESFVAITLAAGALFMSSSAFAADADAAKELARDNNCYKCHAVSKDKDGPAWNKVSQKYKGNADAEATLVKFLTTGKFADGHEHQEDHKVIKDDAAKIKNLVDYILSL